MDEVREFCKRVLGDGAAATEATQEAALEKGTTG
jgi:hypothetical protein